MAQGRGGGSFSGAGAALPPSAWTRLRLGWRLLRDPRVAPRGRFVAPVLAALYVLSPLDVIPDLLLGIGQLDDLGALAVLAVVLTRLLPRLAPAEVLLEHLEAMGFGRRATPGGTGAEGPVIEASFRVKD
jgi:uncharacterized membrane protein YkvA (DUF1232 family)